MSLRTLWSALTVSPWMMYLKLAIVGILVTGAAYMAWDYRGALGEQEKSEAIADAVQAINSELKLEREVRKAYQDLVDDKLVKLESAIKGIKTTSTTINTEIIREVQSNPEFYTIKIPQKGYESWSKSRALLYALPPTPSPLLPLPPSSAVQTK